MNSPFDRIETIAGTAADRYRGLMGIMRSQEVAALGRRDALRPSGVQALRSDLESLSDIYLAQEIRYLVEALTEMDYMARSEATRQTGLVRAEITVGNPGFVEFATDEIEAQLMRDATQILRFHRKRSVDASMRQMAQGVSFDAALMDVRVEGVQGNATMWFSDRAGRRISSHKHIRRFWRALLRDGYMQTLSAEFALRGAFTARIVHPDTGAKGFGEIVHLDGSKPDLSSYENVFHPNAQATLMTDDAFRETYT